MRVPPPPAGLSPELETWAAGREIIRCHDGIYGSTEFNPKRSSQRFRPFTSRRRTVPTIYGAESTVGALSETLFHAVPTEGSDRRARLSMLGSWEISWLEPKRDLRLADLRDDRLPDLGLSREELIESPASAYPRTAEWAAALYHCPLEPDGLLWNSRQLPSEEAFVLFGRDRVARGDLSMSLPSEALTVGRGLDLAYEAAEAIGITLVS